MGDLDSMSSSDDEAPEVVSFNSSKKDTVERMRKAKEVENREKNERKQQRMEVERRNVQQKEQKKSRLLSLDVIKQANKTMEEKEMIENRKREAANDDDKESDEGSSDEDDSRPTAKRQVLSLNEQTALYHKHVQSDAATFKQNHFYNGRVRRITAAQQKSQLLKRAARRKK